MQKRIINVLLTGQLPRAYVVIKVLKETDNMIRFVGADQNGYTPVSYWLLVDIFRNKAKN